MKTLNIRKSVFAVNVLLFLSWILLIFLLVVIDKVVMTFRTSLERSVIGIFIFGLWVVAWYYISVYIVRRKISTNPK